VHFGHFCTFSPDQSPSQALPSGATPATGRYGGREAANLGLVIPLLEHEVLGRQLGHELGQLPGRNPGRAVHLAADLAADLAGNWALAASLAINLAGIAALAANLAARRAPPGGPTVPPSAQDRRARGHEGGKVDL
jgi:hypothetical protein